MAKEELIQFEGTGDRKSSPDGGAYRVQLDAGA